MAINHSYKRTAPDGRTIIITPKNQAQLEYYRSLEDHGFKYEPVVRIHNNLEPCESCSA